MHALQETPASADQGVVGIGDQFRLRFGAGGHQQAHRRIRAHLGQLRCAQRLGLEHLLQAQPAFARLAFDDQHAQRQQRRAQGFDDLAQVDAGVLRRYDHRARIATAHQGLNIEAAAPRWKRRDHGAQRRSGEVDGATAPAVGQLIRHHVAGDDARIAQTGGHAQRCCVQFAVGDAAVGFKHRRFVRVTFGVLAKQLIDRTVGVSAVLFPHAAHSGGNQIDNACVIHRKLQ